MLNYIDNKFSPSAMIAGAQMLHDISGYIDGVRDCYISISQSYQITHYVQNGRFLTYPREYYDDYTMYVENSHGTCDEVVGTANDLLCFLNDLQRYSH